jgi:hypothetical protein
MTGSYFERSITMLTPVRAALVALLSAAAFLALPGSALAAPPPNDAIADAVAFGSIPFSHAVDTREATTALDDPSCVGQGPTVWYAYTPTTSGPVAFDSFGSNYDTTLSAYTGLPGALSQIACNDDTGGLQSRITFDATAGETYYVMAGSYASGPGGDLVVHAQEPPPPLELQVGLEQRGALDQRSGQVTVRGSVACSGPNFGAFVVVEIEQKVGRFIRRTASFGSGMECGSSSAWELQIPAGTPTFVPGAPATARVWGWACDWATCAFVQREQPIQLLPRNR